LTLAALRARTGSVTFDRINGPTNSQATLRLFGRNITEQDVRVTLYRDNHAWCPYCQKVWMWLEEKQIPYRIKKVTMFCYGEKEMWYKNIVPSGMLPALELDGRIITESDVILQRLEDEFGELLEPLTAPRVVNLRRLERMLFGAWCRWLCYPQQVKAERKAKSAFEDVLGMVEQKLQATQGPFFLEEFSCVDVIFLPYLERMAASLFYYKGYGIRDDVKWPYVSAWFKGLETRETYRGTQSDFHTHVHDLPPQMGSCCSSKIPEDQEQMESNQQLVDRGPWEKIPDVGYSIGQDQASLVAVNRVVKHWETLLKVNPTKEETMDTALRCALTLLLTSEPCEEVSKLPNEAAVGLWYLSDRISVPRDMPIHSAKQLRQALKRTADAISPVRGPAIPVKHRRDQSRTPFLIVQKKI